MRRVSTLIAVIAAAALMPGHATAQSVLVNVTRAETSEPLVGALAHLVDEAGETVRSSLTDERGRALFLDVDAARYSVRAEMIGMANGQTDVFEVTADGAPRQSLRLEASAIRLEGIDVSAESRRCQPVASGEGLVVAGVWEEARKALSAAALTERRGLYRYETVRYERELHPGTRAVLSESETRRDGYMRAPFESLPAEDLVENGFVQREDGERIYYAPDAAVLLSDAFLSTHCFRLEDIDEEMGLVGLGFEPTRDNRDTPDIAGTLWLDRASSELRWLEYRYRNLGPDIPSNEASGRVEFRRMPAGTWIVPEWWIRMPAVRVELARNDMRRPRVTGYHQSGGRVLAVREAGGRSLDQRARSGGIEGVVVDSLGALLSGVRVGVIGSNQQVFSSPEGRFSISGLTDGVYQVRFVDPGLEALGYLPPTVTREVIRGEMSYVEYHMPAIRDVLSEACRDDEVPEGSVALIGSVVESLTGRPVAGATVRVAWTDYDATRDLAFIRWESSRFEMTTEADGAYHFCGLPPGHPVVVRAEVDELSTRPDTLRIYGDEGGATHTIRRR